eukprot:TRINITY_DN8486_c0_g1_i1.p1 TRINITY_DN8486_c0_g1~~TRINITY_DN8486_c0_g1_i1.p1  ORF type:complete len:2162 (-),score=449.79 TRINITY_DN8486_c0_g1_i1:17-6502(-)
MTAVGSVAPVTTVPPVHRKLRFFAATLDTATREHVDTKVFYDKLAEYEGVQILEKAAICEWFSQIPIAEALPLKEYLTEHQSADFAPADLVALAYRHKIATLKPSDEEDEEPLELEEGEEPPPPPPLPTVEEMEKQFLLFRGFPTAIEHVNALMKFGVQLNCVIQINSKVALAAAVEEKVDDPKAKGKGKGKDDKKDSKQKSTGKKDDPKAKGKDDKKKKGKDAQDEEAEIENNVPLTQQIHEAIAVLRQEQAQHALRHVLLLPYEMKCEKEEPVETDDPDEPPPPPQWFLVETEDEAVEAIATILADYERQWINYQQWISNKLLLPVPALEEFERLHQLRQVIKEKHGIIQQKLAEQAAQAERERAAGDKKGKKRPDSGGAGVAPAKKKDKAAQEKERQQELEKEAMDRLVEECSFYEAQLRAQPPVTPASVRVNTSYFEKLTHSVPDSALGVPVLLHCLVEQAIRNSETQKPVKTIELLPPPPPPPPPVQQPVIPPSAHGKGQTAAGTKGASGKTPVPPPPPPPEDPAPPAKVAVYDEPKPAPPSVDISQLLSDYLDVALGRLDGTATLQMKEKVHREQKKYLEDAQGGMPDVLTEPTHEFERLPDGSALVPHADTITKRHIGREPPAVVMGRPAADVERRMLGLLQIMPDINIEAAPLLAAQPAEAKEEEEIMQIGLKIGDHLSQEQIDRELLLFELEELFRRRFGGSAPPVDNFEDRTFFENFSDKSSFLQRLSSLFLVEPPQMASQWFDRLEGTGLLVLHHDVPQTRYKWKRVHQEFTGRTFFPEWLEWQAAVAAAERVAKVPASSSPLAASTVGEAAAEEEAAQASAPPKQLTLEEELQQLQMQEMNEAKPPEPEKKQADPLAQLEAMQAAEGLLADALNATAVSEMDKRRQDARVLDLRSKLLKDQPEELCHAGPSAQRSILTEEVTTLYPCDGGIVVSTLDTEDHRVRCTVLKDDVIVGFHCTLAPKKKQEPPPPAPVLTVDAGSAPATVTGAPASAVPSAPPTLTVPPLLPAPVEQQAPQPEELFVYPWGETKANPLYVTATFGDNSVASVTTELKFPARTEGDMPVPELVTTVQYGCFNGLVFSQASSGEITLTYNTAQADIPKIPVWEDDFDAQPVPAELSQPPSPRPEEGPDTGKKPTTPSQKPKGKEKDRPTTSTHPATTPPSTGSKRDKEQKDSAKKSSDKPGERQQAQRKNSGASAVKAGSGASTPQHPFNPAPAQPAFTLHGVPALGGQPKIGLVSTKQTAVSNTTDISKPKSLLEHERTGPTYVVTVWNAKQHRLMQLVVHELRRKIIGKATVARYFRDGTVQLLFANGNCSTCHQGCWLVTNNKGNRTVSVNDGRDVVAVAPLALATNTDSETQAVVSTREDLTMIVNYYDGTRLVQHADGTRIWTNYDGASYRVECERFAAVDLSFTAAGRITTSTELQDRTVIRFTAGEEFAILRKDENYLRLDLATHTVFFEPASLVTVQREAGSQAGLYKLDYLRGGLKMVDFEENQFAIATNGSATVRLFDPLEQNNAENEPQPEDELLETAWGVPLGTLSAVSALAGANAKAAQGVTLATRPSSKLVPTKRDLKRAVAQSVEDIVGKVAIRFSRPQHTHDHLSVQYNNDTPFSSYNSHRANLFLLNADGTGTELLSALDLLPFLSSAAKDVPDTTIEQASIAGHAHLGTLTVTSKQTHVDDVNLSLLTRLVPKAVATMQYKRALKGKHAVGNAEASIGEFMNTLHHSGVAYPATSGPHPLTVYSVRKFLRYDVVDLKYRRALKFALSREVEFSARKDQYGKSLHVADPRSAKEKAEAEKIQVDLLALMRAKEAEAAADAAAAAAKPEAPPLPSAASTPSSKEMVNRLEEKRQALQTMQSNSKLYWNTEEGHAVQQTLPTGPVQKPQPQPRAATTVTPVERKPKEKAPAPVSSGVAPQNPPSPPRSVAGGPRKDAGSDRSESPPQPRPPLDVFGHPRTDITVAALKNTNVAHSAPNATYQQREAGTQRTVKTSSTARLKQTVLEPIADKGNDGPKLVVSPARLDFGAVGEGFVYGMDVLLTNVGTVPCRFNGKIASANGGQSLLNIDYPKGPLAPGMAITATITLTGVSVNELSEVLQFVTEANIVSVPITATIRPGSEGNRIMRKSAVRVLSNAKLPKLPAGPPSFP